MMRPIRTLLLAGLVFAGVPTAVAAEGPDSDACVDRAVAALQRRYESVKDLSAAFVQKTRSVALGSAPAATTVSKGTVVFAKPGKMRWSYAEPEPSLVVSDGKTLWLFDPVHREAQRMPADAGYLSGAAVQFLIGEGDMRRDFRVRAISCGEAGVELELVPRTNASYEKLRIRSDLASGEIRETTVFDLVGNVTEVKFSDVRLNRAPADEVFTFEPPKGVDVIDVGAP